jgi:hypothetical protein
VRIAASAPLDWLRLERLVARHRIAALVYDGLRDAGAVVPIETERRLHHAAQAAAGVALALAAETVRLQSAFEAADLPVRFVKGATLAMRAYGTLGLKQSWDIDLLTAPEHILAARRVLEHDGYALLPNYGDAALLRFATVGKEVVFYNAERDIVVELHWRLLDTARAVRGLSATSAAQWIPLAGAAVATLTDEALYTYLCIHGTTHAWFRLKWLADLAAFATSLPPEAVETLHAAAMAGGAVRESATALLLCHQVLGSPLSDRFRCRLEQDRRVRTLVGVGRYCMTQEEELRRYSRPGLAIDAAHFLMGGFGEVFARKWRSADDRARVSIPDWLGFLYGLLRIPFWIRRRVRGLIAG